MEKTIKDKNKCHTFKNHKEDRSIYSLNKEAVVKPRTRRLCIKMLARLKADS